MNKENVKQLKPRTTPTQVRSKKRAQEIMQVTAQLLDKVGLDDLTTILISKELGISVGSLYHYFPNKHAILNSLAESWLEDWDKLLDEISLIKVETMEVDTVVTELIELFKALYVDKKGILPLVQAIDTIPELRNLDQQHDKLVLRRMTAVFVRLGFNQSKQEIARFTSIFLDIMHIMLVKVLSQQSKFAQRTLDDLNSIICHLLKSHLLSK